MFEHFVEDAKIQQIADAYSLDAVGFTREQFNIPLDWTDRSVEQIEQILTTFHDQLAAANPSDDQVLQFAKMFGSYVGEVFRRNHGATWGMVTLSGQSFPGLKAHGAAGLFWPWGRTQNRLLNGPEDNVWHYYQILVQRNSNEAVTPDFEQAQPQSRTSWWNRFFGN